MSTGEIRDRRRFAQNKLAEMVTLNEEGRVAVLRQLMHQVLEFTPVSSTTIIVENPLLPATATVVAELADEFGPDYTSMHFDLSEKSGVTLRHPDKLVEQVQAANSVVQQYAGEERYPLLIFTTPRGIQFITGDPVPGNSHRLQDILQAVFYWNNLDGDAPRCLAQVGNATAEGEVPRRAFQASFNVYVPLQCRHCDNAITWDDYQNMVNTMATFQGAVVPQGAPTDAKLTNSKTANCHQWVPLSQLDVNERPVKIERPDGETKQVKFWSGLLVEAAEYLAQANMLRPQHCPVHLGNAPNPTIATKPTVTARRKTKDYRKLSNGMYIYVKYNARRTVAQSRELLRTFGVDPATFHVQLSKAASDDSSRI